jgi:CyaY protein
MGTRDDQSVLFSLNALTGGQKPAAAAASPMTGAARGEDSGLIDLNALARAQQSRTAEEASMQPAAPTPLMFPAALGTARLRKRRFKLNRHAPFIGRHHGGRSRHRGGHLCRRKESNEVPPMPAEAVSAPIPAWIPAATAAPVETAAPADSAPKVVKRRPVVSSRRQGRANHARGRYAGHAVASVRAEEPVWLRAERPAVPDPVLRDRTLNRSRSTFCLSLPSPMPDPIDEATFDDLADGALRGLEGALNDVDGLEADLESGILSIEFADGERFIVNSHRAARQIWMAARASAWHFDVDAKTRRWTATKTGDELWDCLQREIGKKLERPLVLSRR